jgi:hypothetical protein
MGTGCPAQLQVFTAHPCRSSTAGRAAGHCCPTRCIMRINSAGCDSWRKPQPQESQPCTLMQLLWRAMLHHRTGSGRQHCPQTTDAGTTGQWGGGVPDKHTHCCQWGAHVPAWHDRCASSVHQGHPVLGAQQDRGTAVQVCPYLRTRKQHLAVQAALRNAAPVEQMGMAGTYVLCLGHQRSAYSWPARACCYLPNMGARCGQAEARLQCRIR